MSVSCAVITVRPFPTPPEANVKKSVLGVSEDYLLSKLPPDGKEIPFVLPSYKSSYIQPQETQYSSYQAGLQGEHIKPSLADIYTLKILNLIYIIHLSSVL